VVANGDIDSPAKAKWVLQITGVDGIMIGRASLGRPWLFGEIDAFLAGATPPPPPRGSVLLGLMREHLSELYAFYGEERGVRVARKHVGWYLKGCAAVPMPLFRNFLAQETALRQQALLADVIGCSTREETA
jgi:tRNA-dihydrouridine synthase B